MELFPWGAQPLVSPVTTWNTIDAVVSSINRELYGTFSKVVLVTINHTTIAIIMQNEGGEGCICLSQNFTILGHLIVTKH